MKKLVILIILGLILGIQPDVFAKTICFTGSGLFWFFSGGKVDQKPFSGNVTAPGFCTLPSWASIITDSLGNYHLSANSPHDPVGTCVSVWFTVSGPTTSSLSGQFDNNQDGTYDGPLTLSEVNCSSIPTAKPLTDGAQGAVPLKSEK